MINQRLVLVTLLVGLVVVCSSQGCIIPNTQYGDGTMTFCVPPIFSSPVLNTTRSSLTLKDRETEIKYLIEHTPHVAQAQFKKMNVTLCQKHFKEYLCVLAFPQCDKGNALLPCVGFCISFWRSCGYNETEIEAKCGTAFAPKEGFSKGLCASSGTFAGIGNGIVWAAFLSAFVLGGALLICASFWGNLAFVQYICCICCRGRKSKGNITEYSQVPQEESQVSNKDVRSMLEQEEFEESKGKSYWIKLFCSQSCTYVGVILLFSTFLFVLSIPIWSIESRNEIASFPNSTVPLGTNLKWTYSSSVYYSFVTMTTIGYGDLFPATVGGRVYMLFYSFFSIITFLTTMVVLSTPLFNLAENVMKIINKVFNFTMRCIFGHSKEEIKSFKITPLMKICLVMLALIAYMLIGSYIIAVLEGWDYGLAFWWTWITFSTIGYGDVSPASVGGRWYFIAFAFVGISQLTLLIGYVGNQFVMKSRDVMENIADKGIDLLTRKKKQEEDEDRPLTGCAKIMTWIRRRILALGSLAVMVFVFLIIFLVLPIPVCALERNNEMIMFAQIVKWDWVSCYYYTFITLSTIGYGDYFPETSDGKVYLMFYSFIGIVMLGYHLTIVGKPLFNLFDGITHLVFAGLIYCTKSKKLEAVEKFITGNLFKSLYIFWIIIAYVFCSAAVMMKIENWSYWDSLWWAWITITTIGYGDLYPGSIGGKIFAVFYGLFGIGLLTLVFGYLAEYFILEPKRKLEEKIATIKLRKKTNQEEGGSVSIGEVKIN